MTTKKRFGMRVKQYRTSAGITQERLAELLDVSLNTISHIERGINGPRFDLIDKIAKTLDVDPYQLFEPY